MYSCETVSCIHVYMYHVCKWVRPSWNSHIIACVFQLGQNIPVSTLRYLRDMKRGEYVMIGPQGLWVPASWSCSSHPRFDRWQLQQVGSIEETHCRYFKYWKLVWCVGMKHACRLRDTGDSNFQLPFKVWRLNSTVPTWNLFSVQNSLTQHQMCVLPISVTWFSIRHSHPRLLWANVYATHTPTGSVIMR